jgi:hypothetical protein
VDAKIEVQGTRPGKFLLPQASSSLDPRTSELASEWFLTSGIQEPDGGVARYYRSDTRQYARVSTEITGYTISTLLFLHQRYGNPEMLEGAVRAGRFLLDVAWSPSLQTFPFECARNGDAPQPLTYFFDCGIIVRGLLALWRATGDPGYLDTAVAAGNSMSRDFRTGDTWHPVLDLPGKYPLAWTEQWSRRPGCYQLKAALAWHDLHRATADENFIRLYNAALAKSLSTKDDFLPAATPDKTMDRLHAYCYFLEALMPAADRLEVRHVIGEGIERVSWYLRELRKDFNRSDVYAQLLRVRLLASRQAGIALNTADASEEAAALMQFQVLEPDSRHNGGFWFGSKAGQMLPFVNPVSTAFCLQAFEWWQDHLSGGFITQDVI